jgi:hypothetical protein
MLKRMQLLVCVGILLLGSCARPVAPSGGQKDEIPPALVGATSSPSLETKFTKRPIVLNFDEWLKAGNAQQIIVSPPLRYSPKVSTRGKTVTFEFNPLEELRENTTYVINFGNYIADLNEGNVLKNFTHVFSTGETIDSLSLRVVIYDTSSKPEEEGVVVMLYDNPRDSNILDRMPLYAGFTEKGGKARIDYIKPGVYYLYALLDKNLNYQFNGGEEKVGFYWDSLVLEEKENPEISLGIGRENPPIARPLFSGKNPGKLEFTYNQPPGELVFSGVPDSVRMSYRLKAEKLEVFHAADQVQEWNLFIENGWGKRDSFAVRSGPQTQGFNKGQKILLKQETQRLGLKDQRERIHFPLPINRLDTLLLGLKIQDGQGWVDWDKKSLYILDSLGWWMEVQSPWLSDTLYQLEILPGALLGLYGDANTDTLAVTLERKNWESYGTIVVSMEDLDSLAQYLYYFMRGEEELVKGQIKEVTQGQLEFKRLLPGKYALKLVRDENKNGMQDKGRVLERRKPEPFVIRNLDELRADWDLELKISVEEALKSRK